MADMFDVQGKRGSIWHRWDPHIHTPGPTASFAAQRKNVEGLAHIIFSANPKQIRFWPGQESATVEELESQYNGCKPCLHGSDAHSLAKADTVQGRLGHATVSVVATG